MQSPITTSRADPGALLIWYDEHHRELPWRISPRASARGALPDPYHIWLSEIMLQQTTVAAVTNYFEKFTRLWPDVHALADAPRDEVLAAWAGLGYYARARNLHKCAGVVSRELGGAFPMAEPDLRALPGIGPYTAAAIAAIAFDRPAVVVDGNVERVMARLHAVEQPLPGAKPVLKGHAAVLTPNERPGDYAQAVMDLGATICTPRRPNCGQCPWRGACMAHAQGASERFPRKQPKLAKPVRHGIAWIAVAPNGDVMTVRRPETGLLGGMRALPSSDWSEAPDPAPPFDADWSDLGEVRHTFTHFHLRLSVQAARLGTRVAGEFIDVDQALDAMPTVFRKALRCALGD